jgi:predicted kinase
MTWKFPKYCESASSLDWDELASTYSWVADMSGVKQDPVHHAEGDVAIHVDMVLRSLLNSEEFKLLSEQDKQILFTATLMHDVEKRSTTIEEPDGSVTSRGHSRKGEMTARKILYRDIQTPTGIRESICKLIRHHGLPLWAIDRDSPVRAVIGSSMVCDNMLLSILAEADANGRKCEDKDSLIFRIGLFRELCTEQDCYRKPYEFSSGLAKFKYFNNGSSWAGYKPFDDTKFEVVLMSGLPGSGKDTYVKNNLSEVPVISLDGIRKELKLKPNDRKGNGTVVQMAKERAKEFMRKHQSFAWNATNITRQMRSQLISLFVQYGASVRIVYVEVPYQKLLQQNKDRENVVPENALEKMIDKLEVPETTEAHSVEYIIK